MHCKIALDLSKSSHNSRPTFIKTIMRNEFIDMPSCFCSIWKFECSFTGMRSEQFLQLLPVLTDMPHLTYLGLRGNHLQNSDVAHLQKV